MFVLDLVSSEFMYLPTQFHEEKQTKKLYFWRYQQLELDQVEGKEKARKFKHFEIAAKVRKT